MKGVLNCGFHYVKYDQTIGGFLMQNSMLRLKAQIPNENSVGIRENIVPNAVNLNDFLKLHFDFPSKNLNEISNFISSDSEMERMIFDIPDFLQSQSLTSRPKLDFMGYCDPGEVVLEVDVDSTLDPETTGQTHLFIIDYLIDNYDVENDYFVAVV